MNRGSSSTFPAPPHTSTIDVAPAPLLSVGPAEIASITECCSLVMLVTDVSPTPQKRPRSRLTDKARLQGTIKQGIDEANTSCRLTFCGD
jgi:hypothetical protein